MRARRPYNHTYTENLRAAPAGLRSELLGFARWLAHKTPRRDLIFLTDMIGSPPHEISLHRIFAALRAALVWVSSDPLSALHARLGYVGSGAGEFPLHADLYLPEMLLITMDRVAEDRSGASVFLGVSELWDAVEEARVPPAAVDRMRSLLQRPIEADGFKDLYQLLHGRKVPWRSDLRDAMMRRSRRIWLGRGEGYLANDRRVLHGRERPTGGVATRRLHRLLFTMRRSIHSGTGTSK